MKTAHGFLENHFGYSYDFHLSKRAYLLNPLELPAAESGSSSQETPTST
jgi:hypothetical protein